MYVYVCIIYLQLPSYSYIQYVLEILCIYFIGGDFDETIKRNSALFILKLKEHYKITQSALSFIIEGFNTMFFQIIEHLRKDVYQNLEENEEYTSRMDFRIKSPFQGLETSYLQERYFEDKLNLLVSSLNCYVRIYVCTYA